MKKAFFGMAVLAVALLFAACKGTEGQKEITSLTLKPAEVVLTEGATVRLSPVVQPTGVKVSFTWSTSDSTIATVSNNGTVTAVGFGEAYITCTEASGIQAKSKISVKSYIETINFTQCWLGIETGTEDSINLIDFKHPVLGDLKVRKCVGVIELFTEGLYYGADGKMTGATEGAIVTIKSPIARAYLKENPDNPKMAQYPRGVSFSLGSYATVDPAKYTDDAWHAVLAGKVDNKKYFDGMNQWLADFNANGKFTQTGYGYFMNAFKESFSGATVVFIKYECDEKDPTACDYYNTNMAPVDGLVSNLELFVAGEDGSSKFMTKVDYLKMDIQYLKGDWGMELVKQEDGTYLIKNKEVALSEPISYSLGEKPADFVAKPHNVNVRIDRAAMKKSEKIQSNLNSDYVLKAGK